MSTELTTLPKLEVENPSANYRMATDVAGLCKEIVLKTVSDIHGKKYVRAEGWLAIATTHGCVAGARDVEHVEGGIRAIGEVRRVSDGTLICVAEGFVGDDETMWAKRPMYARRAMCQTRAISRACRSAFAHVVVLMDAGLSTTPAEEVPDDGFVDSHVEKNVTPTKRTYSLKPPTTPRPKPELLEGDGDEGGDWQDFKIPFGKQKDVRLGDLEPKSLQWWIENYQPKPYKGRISDNDAAFRAALDEAGGKSPAAVASGPVDDRAEDDSEIPF